MGVVGGSVVRRDGVGWSGMEWDGVGWSEIRCMD